MKFLLVLGLVSLVAMVSSVPHSRITVGVEVATDSEIPFQVSISNLGFHCAGVLIDPQWVLTATSCVAGLFEKVATVRVGSRYHNDGGQVKNISKIITNPDFSRSTLDGDIALVKLETPAALNANVQIAAIGKPGDALKKGEFIQISGWGIEGQATGLNPALLRKVSVGYNTPDECVTAYSLHGISLPSRTICAGLLLNSGPAICEGDIGGPAYSVGDKLLYGIASFAYQCGVGPNRPSVFTDVRQYNVWIQSIISPSA